MRNKIVVAVATSALLIGCGSSSSSNDNNSTNSNTPASNNPLSNVTVIDSYVIGARVCDVDGICATTDSYGVASANFNTSDTLTSKGGYIDANLNHIVDADEIKAPDMKSSGNSVIITPITDLIANGADENQLADILGISVDELYSDPVPNNNMVLAEAMQSETRFQLHPA